MVKITDFTGETLGKLVVVRLDRRDTYGGRMVNFWLCHCECGRQEIIPQSKLLKRRQCAVCQRGPCVVCGKPIENERPMSNTCSDVCELIKRRRSDNLSYAKRTATDPDYNRRANQKRMEKIKTDPAKYTAWQEHERERSASRRKSPEKHRMNELARKRYHQDRDAIIARRRERWELLSTEEKQRRVERMKATNQRWYQENKVRIRANNRARWDAMSDDERVEAISRFRAYHRKAARKKMAIIRAYLNR